ncbi:MAG TPA: MFS transporter, partial [Acetobacteraceae bacterium]|nr:MFS transporter [Acetobacteraceae bacterium]
MCLARGIASGKWPCRARRRGLSIFCSDRNDIREIQGPRASQGDAATLLRSGRTRQENGMSPANWPLVVIARSHDSRLLILVRLIRSIGQGALVVDFALYLRALHWSGGAIGALLTASMVSGIALTAVLGPASDRIGRKPLLLALEATRIAAAIVALLTSAPVPLAVAAIAAQYGRGGNGTAGPFGAVEQAWLAQSATPDTRARIFSLNSSMGFFGRTLGALLAALPGLLVGWLPGAMSFRPLFGVVALSSLIAFCLILRIPEDTATQRTETKRPARQDAAPRIQTAHSENTLLLRLALANLLQGAGIGLTGPLIAYWFALRFHAGPGVIGPVMAAGFLMAAAASIVNGRLAQRWGVVPVVVGMRATGIGLLVALPLLPTLPVAAVAYMVRSVFNRGTNGVRAALSMSLVRPERRGFAATVSSVSVSVPRAIGPVV